MANKKYTLSLLMITALLQFSTSFGMERFEQMMGKAYATLDVILSTEGIEHAENTIGEASARVDILTNHTVNTLFNGDLVPALLNLNRGNAIRTLAFSPPLIAEIKASQAHWDQDQYKKAYTKAIEDMAEVYRNRLEASRERFDRAVLCRDITEKTKEEKTKEEETEARTTPNFENTVERGLREFYEDVGRRALEKNN